MTRCKENARGDVAKSPACLPPSHGCVACLALPRKLHSRSPDYSTRIAFTRAPHDALALLNPALPPLITHYPHSRASFLSPDKQSFLPTKRNTWILPWKTAHTRHTTLLGYCASRANPGISTALPASNTTRTLYHYCCTAAPDT